MDLLCVNRDANLKRATWKLNDISDVSEQESTGSLRAKIDLSQGPTKPGTTAMQFIAEGATLSGADFELAGPGYRISLMKKRFSTGQSLDHKSQIWAQSGADWPPNGTNTGLF